MISFSSTRRGIPPGIAGIYWLLAGVISGVTLYFQIYYLGALLLIGGVWFAGSRIRTCLLLVGVAAGFLTCLLNENPKHEFPRFGNFTLRIADWGGMKNSSMVRAEILKVNGVDVRGNMFVRLGDGIETLYADVYRISAFFTPVADGVTVNYLNDFGKTVHREQQKPDGFNRYLENSEMDGVCYAIEIEKLSDGAGVFNFFARIRRSLAARLGSGMNEKTTDIVNAVIFGMKQSLSREEKQVFLQSGVIHLFSVSGLHVGVAALLTMWIFRALPWRMRMTVVLFSVIFYTLLCGAQVPAVRAAIMISTFLTMKMFFARVNPLPVLALAATIIILWMPGAVFDMGFQYSFLITGFLLLTVGKFGKILAALEFQRYFQPPVLRSRGNFAGRIVEITVIGAIVYVASFPLSLYHQGLFTPAAAIVNLMLIFFAPLLFGAAIFKLLFADIQLFASTANRILEWLTDFLEFAVSIGENLYRENCAITPPGWSVVIFLLLLFLLLSGNFRSKAVALGGMTLWISVIFSAHFFMPEFMIVAHGGDGTFALLADPARGTANALNLPDYRQLEVVKTFLSLRGVRRLNNIALLESDYGKPEILKQLIPLCEAVGAINARPAVEFVRYGVKIMKKEEKWRRGTVIFTLQNGAKVINYYKRSLSIQQFASGITEISYKPEATLEVWNQKNTELYIYEYER